jgi:hypothetical protein
MPPGFNEGFNEGFDEDFAAALSKSLSASSVGEFSEISLMELAILGLKGK